MDSYKTVALAAGEARPQHSLTPLHLPLIKRGPEFSLLKTLDLWVTPAGRVYAGYTIEVNFPNRYPWDTQW